MAAPPLRQFGPAGAFTTGGTPDTTEKLYISPEKLLAMYGMTATEGQIRFAMTIVNTVTNRISIWPEEYEERKSIPSDRNQITLSVTPVLQILHCAGRYGYGRRDRRAMNQINSDYIAALAVFGSPPRFSAINVDEIDLYGATGEVWLPTGLFLINYSEVQIRYKAGFTQIPDRINAALAEIINTICQKGASDRNVFSVGRVHRTYLSSSFVTPMAYMFLEPYIVKSLE